MTALHPAWVHTAASSLYFSFFLSKAASIPSSHELYHGGIYTCPASAPPWIQRGCAASLGCWSCRVGRSPLCCTGGTGPGDREECPDHETQPRLWHPPQVCPHDGSVDHCLPCCPFPLLLLTDGFDLIVLLFHFYDFKMTRSFLSFLDTLDHILGVDPHSKPASPC